MWNQYQHLTEEIRTAEILNYQVFGFTIAAMAATVAAAFARETADDRCWLLLLASVVTAPGAFLLYDNRARIWRITTYMRVFMEPQLPGVNWQGHLAKSENINPKDQSSSAIRSEFLILGFASVLIAVLALATALWAGQHSFEKAAASLAGKLAITCGLISISLAALYFHWQRVLGRGEGLRRQIPQAVEYRCGLACGR